MNILVWVSLSMYERFCRFWSQIVLGHGTFSYVYRCIFNLVRYCQITLLLVETIATPIGSKSDEWKILWCCSNGFFFDSGDAKHLFVCLLGSWSSSSMNCLFKSFAHFPIALVSLLIVKVLYLFWILLHYFYVYSKCLPPVYLVFHLILISTSVFNFEIIKWLVFYGWFLQSCGSWF